MSLFDERLEAIGELPLTTGDGDPADGSLDGSPRSSRVTWLT